MKSSELCDWSFVLGKQRMSTNSLVPSIYIGIKHQRLFASINDLPSQTLLMQFASPVPVLSAREKNKCIFCRNKCSCRLLFLTADRRINTQKEEAEKTPMFMNAELRQRLQNEIILLENARKEYLTRLEALHDYADVLLRRTKRSNNKYYYYEKRPGLKGFIYLGLENNNRVKRIREARFLKEAIRRIDRDIDLMKALVDGFLPYDPSSINESMPRGKQARISEEISGKLPAA